MARAATSHQAWWKLGSAPQAYSRVDSGCASLGGLFSVSQGYECRGHFLVPSLAPSPSPQTSGLLLILQVICSPVPLQAREPILRGLFFKTLGHVSRVSPWVCDYIRAEVFLLDLWS